ncbi:hypothetical protein Tco_1219554 [Tanacetum coccineum]
MLDKQGTLRLEEACKKKRKKRATPRTPSGSPPSPPPPPPPLAGASGAPGISGTSGSSQLPPPPPPPSTSASRSAQQAGSEALSSSKLMASIHQSMAWTTSNTRFESTNFMAAQELSPTDSLMQDDSIPDEQVHLSDDEDSGNDHLPKADSRQDWWKPLPEEKRPSTPKPTWTIPSSNVSDIENNCEQDARLTQSRIREGRAYEDVIKHSTPRTAYTISFQDGGVSQDGLQLRLTGRIQKEIKSESMSTDHCLSVSLQFMSTINTILLNKDL